MSKDLIINVTPQSIDIALLEDKKLVELNSEKSNLKFSVGDIYLGKVKKLMPGLNAAFVDVGYDKDAFLHYQDLGPQFRSLNKLLENCQSKKGRLPSMHKFKREKDINKEGKIQEVLKSGHRILVQIAKEPISTKGPRLTSEIAIAGRNMVLMPFADKVSVSQKITSAEERNRLKTLLQSIRPRHYGIIVRTAAENKKVAILDTELRNLVKKWESSFEKLRHLHPSSLVISELSRTSAMLRDILSVSFTSIHINDETMHREIKEYIETIAPEKKNIVKLYKGKIPIFEKYGIEKQIKASFGKTVSFKNGAYLIIEHTEALHVIDVNSGNRSKSVSDQATNALEVNLAAAEEIARQLRLRDMGGIIVVDFIDMHNNDHKQKVFEKMKKLMEEDRTKNSILPLSRFGLMEITRQRVRPELHISTNEECPSCGGTGKISPSILFEDVIENHLADLLSQIQVKKVWLKVHPYIAAYLRRGMFSIRYKWSVQYKCKIKVKAISSYDFLEFHVFDKYGDEIPAD